MSAVEGEGCKRLSRTADRELHLCRCSLVFRDEKAADKFLTSDCKVLTDRKRSTCTVHCLAKFVIWGLTELH